VTLAAGACRNGPPEPSFELCAGSPLRWRDDSTLEAPRAHVHIARWVPQADVLRHARVVVCHGGSGTTLGALAAGVPLVVTPLFDDQPDCRLPGRSS